MDRYELATHLFIGIMNAEAARLRDGSMAAPSKVANFAVAASAQALAAADAFIDYVHTRSRD